MGKIDELRLARARETERERERKKAMVFLDVLVNYGCRRWLHKEDYSFDEDEVSSSSRPSQYPLLGFKDRHLEDEYLEHFVVASRARIILGSVTGILLYASGPFAGTWFVSDTFISLEDAYRAFPDEEEPAEGHILRYFPNSTRIIDAFFTVVFLGYILGLVGLVCMYQMKRFEKYRTWILHITSTGYLVYMGFIAFMFAFSNHMFDVMYGPYGWLFQLMFSAASPLASLFFITLPPLVMLELMIVFVSGFLVIVPLCNPAGNLWNLMTEAVTSGLAAYHARDGISAHPELFPTHDEDVVSRYEYPFIMPIILLCVLVVCLVVVSVIVDISNRQSFINKKIIEALTKQREGTLLQQKEDHENLIHSIFPPAVTKDLTRRQSSKSLSKVNSEMGCKSFGHKNFGHVSLGRSVAQMHHEVTILFTDIVGFTSMSQTVAPQQVMEFLHDLFVRFDDLVDMDSSFLWKVETIGDAFMIASGLKHTEGELGGGLQNRKSTARAAVLFGKSALAAARTLTMPNSMQCQIRAGVHTGDVCSGVVGTRMPRYCLFGDTVNTASRMESSGVPGR